MNMIRSILKGRNSLKESWGEAVSISAYLFNRCPIKRLEKVTPEEARSRFKPNMNHLTVFESLAYRRVLEMVRKKMNDKG